MFTAAFIIHGLVTFKMYVSIQMQISVSAPSFTGSFTWKPQRFLKCNLCQNILQLFLAKSYHILKFHLSRWYRPSICFGKLWFGKLICLAYCLLPAPSPSLYLHLLSGMDSISSPTYVHVHSGPTRAFSQQLECECDHIMCPPNYPL